MEKIIVPSSWNLDEAVTQLVKYSSKGLVGHDYSVLVKRAGASAANWLKNVEIADDQIPLHVIAMGATEAYGPNRNGDGFKEAALKAYHNTFVKYANHYRHHKNKDEKIRYGLVKASFYNPEMRRVELLIALNKTKEAAEKYGGFVADREQEIIESGKDLPVSMAAKVAYDVCSGCGNKARDRREYCTEDTCKYGGCRDNLTKVAADGHVLHVDNPHPTFFDISTVIKPADRIAYGNLAEYLQKSASCEHEGGAALAEAYNIIAPPDVYAAGGCSASVVKQMKLAFDLSAIEANIESNQSRYENVARAFTFKGAEIDLSPIGRLGSEKAAAAFRALADHNVLLPVRDFLRLTLDNDSEKLASVVEIVPDLLPGVFNRLTSTQQLFKSALQTNNLFIPSQKVASATQREWAKKLAADYSVAPDDVRRRVTLSAIRNMSQPTLLKQATYKTALDSRLANKLAGDYALYKLAYLAYKNIELPFTRELVVLHNYIS